MAAGKLTGTAAVLLVRDLHVAAAYYKDKLGFNYDQFFGDPPSFVIVYRDGMSLMLRQAQDAKHVVPHWTVSPSTCDVYFWVTGVDDLHRDFVSRGAKIDYGLCDQPHGCREFGVQDPDGHDISFGEYRS